MLEADDRHLEAVSCYREALALRDDLGEVWSNLGNAFTALARYEEAICAYRRALDAEPESARFWFNLAYARSGLGQLEEQLLGKHQPVGQFDVLSHPLGVYKDVFHQFRPPWV